MTDVTLPELPPDCEGYSYAERYDAARRASAMLPVNAITCHLGADVLEEALVLATCLALRPEPNRQAQLDAILLQLPRKHGRHRTKVGRPA